VKNIFFILITALFFSLPAFAQGNEIQVELSKQDSLLLKPYTIDPLAPAKAAFFSGLVPGLGQIYNKRYWKAPIAWGGMGISLYYYNLNNKNYHWYRDTYKDLLAGRPVTGDLARLNGDKLIRGQKFYRRNRDLSMFVTIGIYILNIVDANVDAHLKQFNVNENLTFNPSMLQSPTDNRVNMGFTLNYQF
jgi:hypothetical protein